jgi:hypothetical protein
LTFDGHPGLDGAILEVGTDLEMTGGERGEPRTTPKEDAMRDRKDSDLTGVSGGSDWKSEVGDGNPPGGGGGGSLVPGTGTGPGGGGSGTYVERDVEDGTDDKNSDLG